MTSRPKITRPSNEYTAKYKNGQKSVSTAQVSTQLNQHSTLPYTNANYLIE
jgi:hypothetical protein